MHNNTWQQHHQHTHTLSHTGAAPPRLRSTRNPAQYTRTPQNTPHKLGRKLGYIRVAAGSMPAHPPHYTHHTHPATTTATRRIAATGMPGG